MNYQKGRHKKRVNSGKKGTKSTRFPTIIFITISQFFTTKSKLVLPTFNFFIGTWISWLWG
ncbi:hypothetical protein NSP_29070 [Nodularia spumigena CCY9414]|nr:hypothetical protein NSP_29070 [Nodularia spumigena CCY9414]